MRHFEKYLAYVTTNTSWASVDLFFKSLNEMSELNQSDASMQTDDNFGTFCLFDVSVNLTRSPVNPVIVDLYTMLYRLKCSFKVYCAVTYEISATLDFIANRFTTGMPRIA